MVIHQKASGNWTWNVLEPSRAAVPFCATGSWKSCVSRAWSHLHLVEGVFLGGCWIIQRSRSFPQLFKNRFKLASQVWLVGGPCWGIRPMWSLHNHLFSMLSFIYLWEQERRKGLTGGNCHQTSRSSFLYIPSIVCFPLCLESAHVRWMFSLLTWSLRLQFAFQGREIDLACSQSFKLLWVIFVITVTC